MGNNRGSILVFTLSTVAALMIVGLTFTTIATSEYRSAMAHTESVQAFYIAESGLNWLKHALDSGVITLPQDLAVGSEKVLYRSPGFPGTGPTSTHLSDLGELKITAKRTSEGYTITSEGLMNGAKKNVSIKVEVGEGSTGFTTPAYFRKIELSPDFIIDGDVTADEIIMKAWNSKIKGNVYMVGSDLSKLTKTVNQTWANLITGTISNVPAAPILSAPDFTGYPPASAVPSGAFIVDGDKTITISEGGSYTNFSVQNSGKLYVDIKDHNDIVIHAHTLNISGAGQIILQGSGSGRLVFHVTDKITVEGSGKLNAQGDFDKVDLYYYGTQAVNAGGQTVLKCSLITKTANITIANGGGFTGHIISGCSNINVTGNASAHLRVLYAPQARLNITGSGYLKGVIAADMLFGSGEGKERLILDNAALDSFARFAGTLGLWPKGDAYIYHTWGSR